MKYYIIAGEVSGDLHASFLMKELKAKDEEAEFRVWGGDNMLNEGATVVKHIKDLSFMGFVEVITNLKTILTNLRFCKKDIIKYKPDAVIFVDYPGFNLKMATFCHLKGFKTIYYISPKVWAWKKGRIKLMKKVLTRLYVIFPFEQDFFKKHDLDVEYYGNPLLDEIQHYSKTQDKGAFLKANNLGDKPIIALLPGSRVQEIKTILSIQMTLVDKFPDFDFVIAGLDTHKESFYRKFMDDKDVKIINNQTYSILSVSYCAIVCSGTATLETALFNVPEVVCYKANPISFAIGKMLVNLKYISLVNLILDRPAVVELLQKDWNEESLEKEFRRITYDEGYRTEIEMNYSNLKILLGDAGASNKIAKSIIKLIQN
ncbi:MAG: lipid-A-disaccharide synthase [Bacteroidales bacterium]|nr:lipid-A-disaccharide synthase [Bacteroidales bacterium]